MVSVEQVSPKTGHLIARQTQTSAEISQNLGKYAAELLEVRNFCRQ